LDASLRTAARPAGHGRVPGVRAGVGGVDEHGAVNPGPTNRRGARRATELSGGDVADLVEVVVAGEPVGLHDLVADAGDGVPEGKPPRARRRGPQLRS